MKALTLRPQWAWAVAHSTKRVEYRSWMPRLAVGETLAIHAGSAKFWDDDLEEVQAAHGAMPPTELDGGAVVALAVVSELRSGVDGWEVHLADVRTLKQPQDCRGKLGLWSVPDDIAAACLANV